MGYSEEQLGDLFNEIDVDGSGKIELNELCGLVTKIYPDINEADVELFLRDKNLQCPIDFATFASSGLMGAMDTSSKSMTFSMSFDTILKRYAPGQTHLSEEHMRSFIKDHRGINVFSEEDIMTLFCDADTNGDKLLSKEEFVDYCLEFLGKIQ